MKILVDMNLSPAWVPVLRQAGHEVTHWSTIGAPSAADQKILAWAREHRHVLFTHDLDFGAILAATGATAPSVVQIRTQDVSPNVAKAVFLAVLQQFHDDLDRGVLITVDAENSRARLLPIRRAGETGGE